MPLKKSAYAMMLPKDGGRWSCIFEDKPKKLRGLLSEATGEAKLPKEAGQLSILVELCLRR